MSRDNFIKMHGAWDTRHWISIPGFTHEADGLQIETHLLQLVGVQMVETNLDSKCIRVTYDQTRTHFYEILSCLRDIGFEANQSWWWRKKATWFQYLDNNAKANANAPEPICCSDPKEITGRPKRQL